MKVQKIKMELIKVQKIFNWFIPKNFKKLYRFFGFMNYNQQFIKNIQKHHIF